MTLLKSPKIGIGLSGGGYRAAAFHLGTLRKLNELGILSNVQVVSTVSGGSIVGADYLLSLTEKIPYSVFEQSFIGKLKKSVIRQVLRSATFISIVVEILLWLIFMIYFQFTCYPWISWILFSTGILAFMVWQFKIFPVSIVIEGIYNHIFFTNKKLTQFPESPIVAINSTNLEAGRQFTFSKESMGDSTYDYTNPPIRFTTANFPIARSVMASSCVPSFFTPVFIDEQFYTDRSDISRAKPRLVDGGVYDNQGIHKLTVEGSRYACNIVIISDAGDRMPFRHRYGNTFVLLLRTVDLFMNRIKKFQISNSIFESTRDKKREIAYISLGWDLKKFIPGFVSNLKAKNIPEYIIQEHKIPGNFLNPFQGDKIEQYLKDRLDYKALEHQLQSEAILQLARDVSTNLTALSDEEINALVNQAELMTELQVKLYCASAFQSSSIHLEH